MSDPVLTVDLDAAEPPYEQIRSQIAGLIAAGTLRPGQRLPTIRALAGQLGLASNTVARAYKELETGGLIATRRRTGTVVSAAPAAPTDEVREGAAAYAELARRLGLSETAAVDLLRTAYRHP